MLIWIDLITVKIVDFEHESEMERKVAKDLRVGDCHGKISPRLAKVLGGKENTPFQFRLANYSSNSPLPGIYRQRYGSYR